MIGHVVKQVRFVHLLRRRQYEAALGGCVVRVHSIGPPWLLRSRWPARDVRLQPLGAECHQIADNQARELFAIPLDRSQTYTAAVRMRNDAGLPAVSK